MMIRTKRRLQTIGTFAGMGIVLTAIGALFFLMLRSCDVDRRWRKHDAEHQLGSGAVCSDVTEDIVPCIKDNQPYQCIVGDKTACSKVDRLP